MKWMPVFAVMSTSWGMEDGWAAGEVCWAEVDRKAAAHRRRMLAVVVGRNLTVGPAGVVIFAPYSKSRES